MGLGTRGHGHSRFNAGKLNAYLHGLNRRLQEENEGLVDRLKRAEVATTGSRPTGGARRISVGAALGDVEEDVRGEGWVEEKAELEELVDAFKEEVQQCISEKEELEKALDEEREARVRDRVKWKERMGEVEKGVEGIVKELEERLSDAEKRTRELEGEKREHFKDMEKRLASLEAQRDLAMERAQKAELALESGVALGGELREANERVGKIMGDLRNANTQISELEEEVMMSDRRIDQLEKALLAEKEATGDLEQELQIKLDELAAAQNKIGNLKEEAKTTEEDLRAASELASQMDVALEAAEKKVLASDQELADFKERLSSLEQERAQEGSASQSSQNHITLGPTDADLEALENELDNANREIARLSTLLSQSPLRKAMDNAKDIKIDVLEREKEDLLEKIQALRMTVTGMGTPSKIINNNSGISPIHRQALSMSMRAPKTPGGPLRDVREII
jgi:predicted  nucleic acid-binding Zn-ribbon protein